jgi:DNA-binding NarL/FixJ family response regulator
LLSREDDIEVVGEAANGRELMKMVNQLRPDVIITDIAMPVGDGIETTRKIKAQMPKVSVIGLSALEDEGIREKMLQSGADAFVPKSSAVEGLFKSIRSCRKT